MSQKVQSLESSIVSGDEIAELFFKNSFEFINGIYYHILFYRAL